MARINLINPALLTDQHLIAEYNEIYLVLASLKRSLKSKTLQTVILEIPKQFCLGTGHIKFFYNKLKYLKQRYYDIIEEMHERNFNTSQHIIDRTINTIDSFDDCFKQDWQPDLNDCNLILKRINSKIENKKTWYRYKGVKLTEEYTLNL